MEWQWKWNGNEMEQQKWSLLVTICEGQISLTCKKLYPPSNTNTFLFQHISYIGIFLNVPSSVSSSALRYGLGPGLVPCFRWPLTLSYRVVAAIPCSHAALLTPAPDSTMPLSSTLLSIVFSFVKLEKSHKWLVVKDALGNYKTGIFKLLYGTLWQQIRLNWQ